MLLVLPILVPLSTAITLQLLPKRPATAATVAFAGALAASWLGAAMFLRVEAQAFRSCRSGHGRRRSASPWSPICSARCWW